MGAGISLGKGLKEIGNPLSLTTETELLREPWFFDLSCWTLRMRGKREIVRLTTHCYKR